MTVNAEFWGFFCTAVFVVLHSEADHRLPAPKSLSYTWVDPFTLNMSWSWDKPKHLPDECEIQYEIHYPGMKKLPSQLLKKNSQSVGKARTIKHHYEINFLTDEVESNEWKFSIHALTESCTNWTESKPENITIKTWKPRDDVVKDFKCCITSDRTNCSWEPLTSDLSIFYRFNGETKEKRVKRCEKFYSDGKRSGCDLSNESQQYDIDVLAENEVGLQTFKAKRVFPLPKLNIREDGSHLNLEWTTLDVVKSCSLYYVVCYSKCNTYQGCMDHTSEKDTLKHGPVLIPYDKNCRYEFKFNATTVIYCPELFSDGTAVEFYGNNTGTKLPKGALTVVAVVIPVILSVSVFLSCYCFRRTEEVGRVFVFTTKTAYSLSFWDDNGGHCLPGYLNRAILCPTMPDPSAIFKEIMNGNKEPKTTSESLYTPVPEPIEHCIITPLTENSIFQQNS